MRTPLPVLSLMAPPGAASMPRRGFGSHSTPRSRPPKGPVFLAVVAHSLLLWGCSEGKSAEKSPGGTLGPASELPELPLASRCATPDPPAPLQTSRVIGDGTPESCDAAALQAGLNAGGDLTFDCGNEPHTLLLDEELVASLDALLDGGGLITLDGQDRTRILRAEQEVHLAVRGLTFTRGAALDGDDPPSGGAIAGGWRGSLDVRECDFLNNSAGVAGEAGGGAIYTPSRTMMTIVGCRFAGNHGGTGGAVHNLLSGLTVVDSIFSQNESLTDGGGGLYTDGASEESDDDIGGLIDLCGCRFEGNVARRQGGGAYLFAYGPDQVRVNQSAFVDNSVLTIDGSGALGGGLRVGNAPLDLGHCLFANNTSMRHGGGLWVDGNFPSRVSNSTFTENYAGEPGLTDGGYGGAISGAALVMTNLTVANNRAESAGGGIFSEDESSELFNSIVASNSANNEWGIRQNCRYTIQGANNLQWPDPGDDVACTEGIDIADPLLLPLADNGSPLESMLPDTGSPALDAGLDCPSDDQRGEPRSEPCDLGAVEL